MNPPQGEETIFAEALRLPPEERAAYLAESTTGKAELRRRVESLLGSYLAGDFLEGAAAPQLHPTIHLTVPLTEKPGDSIGRYKLLQRIGEGGCGIVYMAEQAEPVRRRVALKIIKLGMDTKSVIARFDAERQAVAMMDHPNIAKVFDAGATETGRPYFVMELVRGMKLTDYCDETKLSTRGRLELFIQVCQALQHAHQKGIIHRDIKPSNILVTINDGVPVPKVIDFGIAKATSGQQLTDKTLFTAFEQFIGTPAYMSPEQAVLTSLDIDTRSDVYALGVLLYELLTGKTPFDGQQLLAIGLDEMRRTIREQEPPRPSTRLSTLPGEDLSTTAQRRGLEAPKLVSELRGDLDWIVMKALEKDRSRRYETANGLASDIKRHLNNEPVLACPPSRLYRLQKTVRRNRVVFFATTAIALALVMGVIVSAWQAGKARRAERVATEERDSAEAVLKFFQEKVLAADRPEGREGGLGKDATLRKAIDAAEPQITASFQTRPTVEAAIRHTLGESYSHLGEMELGIQQKERALTLHRRYSKNGHPEAIKCMISLGVDYIDVGRYQQGLAVLEEALSLQKRELGPTDPATVEVLGTLSWAYARARKKEQSVASGEKALELMSARLGTQNHKTQQVMDQLAVAYLHSNKPEKAIPLLQQLLQSRKETPDGGNYKTLAIIANLGQAYLQAHQPGQAVPLYEEVYRQELDKLGLSHPSTLRNLHWLATAYLDAGDISRAMPLFHECLRLKTITFGATNGVTLQTAEGLDHAYRKAGRLAELEAMYRGQLAQRIGDVMTVRFWLGRVLAESAEFNRADPNQHLDLARESEQLLREFLAEARIRYTNNPQTLAAKLNDVADVRNFQRRYEEAEPLYREISQLRKAGLSPDDTDVLIAGANLGRVLSDWAWASRTSAATTNSSSSFINSSQPLKIRASPASYERAREAERLLRDVLVARLRESTNSWRIADIKSRLGSALVSRAVADLALNTADRENKLREAELLLLEAHERSKDFSTDEDLKRQSLEHLARLYEAWNKLDQRLEWERKFERLDKAQTRSLVLEEP